MNPRAAIDALPPRGYRWWYVDGLSDDGRRAFTAIFLVGHVFSPWNARRAWRGELVPPVEHLGVHLALYEDERQVGWTMAEYPAARLEADERTLRIGGSSLVMHDDGSLEGTLSTRSAPMFFSGLGVGRALTGRFKLGAGGAVPGAIELGSAPDGALHFWQVRTPSAAIEVEFDQPRFSFRGRGYHDGNWGLGRLEEAFRRWSWARFPDGRILYTVEPRQGSPRGIVVHGAEARVGDGALGEGVPTGWGLVAANGFTAPGARVDVTRWLERTPFYARYVAALDGAADVGERAEGVGEFLDLDRFQRADVQFLLRWRAQRRHP